VVRFSPIKREYMKHNNNFSIETEHELVGQLNSKLGDLDIGTNYPVLAADLDTIIGVFSAEFGEPDGYKLSDRLQAFVKIVGESLAKIKNLRLEIEDYCPVLASDNDTIIGMLSDSDKTPSGYELDRDLEAYVEIV